jgi:hypothetical protein
MITPRQMSVILDNGKRVIESGEFAISIGGGQPGFAKTTGVVTGKFAVAGKTFELKEK